MISATDMLSFPAVTLGDAASISLHVTNQGPANLMITDIDFPTPDLYLEGAFPIQIAPRESAGEQCGTSATTPLPWITESDWGHVWLFDVAKNFSGETAGDEIVLEFSDVDAIPEGLAILLVDRTLERAMDVRKEIRCLFYQGTRGYVARDDDARFALLVGSDEFVESYGDGLPAHPSETVLHQNHPNPFNPSTIIRYELAKTGRVTLKLYDVSGALVKVLEDRDREPGRYEVGWNGLNERGEHVSSGVYFYVLETPGARLAKKMLCVK